MAGSIVDNYEINKGNRDAGCRTESVNILFICSRFTFAALLSDSLSSVQPMLLL